MARNFEILITPTSGVSGNLAAVIEADRVRRDGTSQADSPSMATVSPSVRVNTRVPLTATWDVPDRTIRSGKIEVGIDFPFDVLQDDGRDLTEEIFEWLSFHGLEINGSSVRVDAVVGERFSLRLTEVPASVGHDANFQVGVRTTFDEELTAAPTASALTLSAGTVNSVCQIVEDQSYLFDCTSPSSGTADITITAVASGWSNLSANHVFEQKIQLTS